MPQVLSNPQDLLPPIAGLTLVGKPNEGTRPTKKEKDKYTDYLPRTSQPQTTPLSQSIPTLPPPSSMAARQKNEKKQAEKAEKSVFKSHGPFGMPFQIDSGSEIGATPHPQLVMVRMVEDCTHTMAVGREFTTRAIVKGDHVKQREISEDFDKKLGESLRIARENQQLSYLQNALKFVTITAGIGGGLLVASAAFTAGNGWGMFYGAEMITGGLLELGSFCLDQIGVSKDSSWSSLLAIGGGLLTFHGGLMGNTFLCEMLPKHFSAVTASTLSLLQGYGVVKSLGNEAERLELTGELTRLGKERKEVSKETEKHYGALNISDFKLLFKTAAEFVDQTNRATKKIIQGTLRG